MRGGRGGKHADWCDEPRMATNRLPMMTSKDILLSVPFDGQGIGSDTSETGIDAAAGKAAAGNLRAPDDRLGV